MAENPSTATPTLSPSHLQVSVVTGDHVLYRGPAVEVSAPAVGGAITLRRSHAPLVAMLQPGELDVVHQDGTDTWAVGGGLVEVIDNVVTVLADTAERAEEIDLALAEEALERAQLLARRYEAREELRAAHDLALRRSRARIAVARKVLQGRA